MVSEVGEERVQVATRDGLAAWLEERTAWCHHDCVSMVENAWGGRVVHAIDYGMLLLPGDFGRTLAFPSDREDWRPELRYARVGLR